VSETKKPAPQKGKDLEAFRAAHDRAYIVPQRIKAGLDALGESWEYESEFTRRCGIAPQELPRYRDQFREFCVEPPRGSASSPKRVWAGSKAFAAKLRATFE
jgi:hypothetical protein